MSNKFIPVAAVGALLLAASVFATAQASVNGGTALKPSADAGAAIIQVKDGKGGSGGGKGGGAKGVPGKMTTAPKGSFKGLPKGSPKIVKKGIPKNGFAKGPKGPPIRWTRDRRYRYYGAFFAVPFGFALYAEHYCYDWRYGPRGWGYYWNYRRCPL